jgi:hypothetical protein
VVDYGSDTIAMDGMIWHRRWAWQGKHKNHPDNRVYAQLYPITNDPNVSYYEFLKFQEDITRMGFFE